MTNDVSIPDEQALLAAMQRYGGGFARALAQTWTLADKDNRHKLRREFGEFLESYRSFIKEAL